MEMHLSEDQVFRALHECCGDKALGSDDMPMAFLQHNWDILKVDILRMCSKFHSMEKFVKSLNDAFIVLIPKKSGVEDIRDYQPISLSWACV